MQPLKPATACFVPEDQIMAAVVEAFGFSEEAIRGPSRRRCVVRARHAFYWLMVHSGGRSQADLARHLAEWEDTIGQAVRRVSRETGAYQPELGRAITTLNQAAVLRQGRAA